MPNLTTNYSFNKPLVNDATDEDLWGGYLNDNWDSIDGVLPTLTASKYGAVVIQATDDASLETINAQGSTGQVLTSNGPDAAPSWQAAPLPGSASSTAAGIVELLADAEFNTGTDSSRAMLVSNFVKSIGASGYITLPGALIIQWGKYTGGASTGTITYPTAFGTATYCVVAMADNGGGANGVIINTSAQTASNWSFDQRRHDGASPAGNFFWIAIGK